MGTKDTQNIRPISGNGDNMAPVGVTIRLADGRNVVVKGAASPLHAEWLWDMFHIPEPERKDLIELVLPQEAIQPFPPR